MNKNMRIESTVVIRENGVTTSNRIVNVKTAWTPSQRGMLLFLADKGVSWETIGAELHRPASACRSMYTYVSLKSKLADRDAEISNLKDQAKLAQMIMDIDNRIIANLEETVAELSA
jgi:hypothetical protein